MAHTAVDHHGHHQPGFVERWFFSTNHKDIGTLYLLFSFVMFIIGAAMSVVIRAELMQPGLQFVKPEFFNQMTTVHALVMIFGGVMPRMPDTQESTPAGITFSCTGLAKLSLSWPMLSSTSLVSALSPRGSAGVKLTSLGSYHLTRAMMKLGPSTFLTHWV